MNPSVQISERPRPWALASILLAGAIAQSALAAPRTSSSYGITADFVDSGGQRITSAAYISEGSIGGTGGASMFVSLITDIVQVAAVVPFVTSALTASGTAGQTFPGYAATGTDSPTSYSATGLPAGLTLDSSTGRISGTPTVSGTFNVTLRVGNSVGFSSVTLVLTIASDSYLANLSVRAGMAAGQTLIVGFVVEGGAKPMLIRAAGPGLNKFGLTGVVDPKLVLFAGDGRSVATNDNWDVALKSIFASLGAFAFDEDSKDAALQQSINGLHTVAVTSTNSGAILVEAYDAGPNDGRKLINLSTRFQVGTGGDILIAGFVLAGTGTKQVLVRAVGPTLASFGVPGVLADPQLAVFDGATVIASNNDWSSTLAPTFANVGAFALGAGSRDAALVITLQAGKAYTVQVSGVGNTTGEALIEIYALP